MSTITQGTGSKSKPSKSARKAVVEDTLLIKVIQRYFKLAGVASVAWLAGYFNYSVSWLWLFLVLFVWKEKHQMTKNYKRGLSVEIAQNEREVILARVDDLPSWVHFPDVERVEWINKILCQMWPFIGDIVERILRDSVEKTIAESLPTSFKSLKFSKINLGSIPPRIGGVKVYTQIKRDEIYMDLELNYTGDAYIEVTVKKMSAGIRNLRLHGTLRVVLRPLIGRIPLVGGMLVFFLNNPELDFDLTSLANALELPGLSDMLYSTIQEQISNFIVLPNRFPIKLVDGLDLNKLRFPLPQGVIRIRVIEAKDLINADYSIGGRGLSDPYCKIRVGAKMVKTKVIQNSLDPVWNETFDLIVDLADGQLLYVDVYDEDTGLVHDQLGSVTLDLSVLRNSGFEDEWLPLEDVKHGMIHLQLTWLWLANKANELDRVCENLAENESTHVAILLVYLDSASSLPVTENSAKACALSPCRGKKTLHEPSPQAVLTVGQQVEESMIKYDTSEPRWEQNFRFLLHNPSYQNLDIEIMDTRIKKPIGGAVIKLKQLLVAEDMVMDQKFHLKIADPRCCVQMRLCLRVLTPNFNIDYLDENETLIEEVIEPKKMGGSHTTVHSTQGGSSCVDIFDKEMKMSVAGSENKYTDTLKETVNEKTVARADTLEEEETPAQPPSVPVDRKNSEVPATRQRRLARNPSLVGHHGLGRIQLTIRYSHQRGHLITVVHKCMNLKPLASDRGTADSYVRLTLLPEKSSSGKRRSKVIKENLNPIFDEIFEYPVDETDLARRQLSIAVKQDVGIFSISKTEMGQVLLDLSTLDTSKAVTEWFDLSLESTVKPTPIGFDNGFGLS